MSGLFNAMLGSGCTVNRPDWAVILVVICVGSKRVSLFMLNTLSSGLKYLSENLFFIT